MQWSTGAAEHCSGIVEVIGSNSVQAWSFFRPYLHYCSSSVHYCEDRSHIQVFIRSSHTWFSYIHSHSLLLPLILQYQHKYKEICNHLTKDLLEDNVLAVLTSSAFFHRWMLSNYISSTYRRNQKSRELNFFYSILAEGPTREQKTTYSMCPWEAGKW